jgi:1,4-alpha-glucan branching enzyme
VVAEDMSGMPGLCRTGEDGGLGFTHRLGMGLPDFWIRTLKKTRDEDLDLGHLWGAMDNRRRGEATIAYVESHDQALVGDKTIAFRLMDQEMYWHMSLDDDHPVIDRGIALHKMIRLVTFALGGEGWLNFMGNEFGHPEWVDFPREGNGWSFKYCRRQWSLVDNHDLKYQYLAAFDRAMLALERHHKLLDAPPGRQLWLDHEHKILCFERAGLVFVFNFSPAVSLPDYRFPAPAPGDWRMILDTDLRSFGGHARVDPAVGHPPLPDPEHGHPSLMVYTPARTAQVLAKN